MQDSFYKRRKTDKVWWLDNRDTIGDLCFSFDKKQVFNFFQDYPQRLTQEEKIIFDKENPMLARLK